VFKNYNLNVRREMKEARLGGCIFIKLDEIPLFTIISLTSLLTSDKPFFVHQITFNLALRPGFH
jgi:hypothetical protein